MKNKIHIKKYIFPYSFDEVINNPLRITNDLIRYNAESNIH